MTDFKKMVETLEQTTEKDRKLTPKQEQILKAAVEIFAEKGYASSSTSEIAAKANVAEGTIFRHYKTKKELLISIVTPFMTKFTLPFFASHFAKEVFEEPPEGLESLLRTLLKNRFEFAKENAPLLRIVIQEMAFHPELQENFQEVFLEEIFPKFEEALNHLKEKGKLVEMPNASIIRMIISSVVGFLVTRFIIAPDLNWEDEKEIDYTIDFIMHGLAQK
ncbi:TetR/AcrR family transcriptional regulator [Halobacillus sp. SY10]|uniref:DNA-binding transcriptional regulator, AcrR family n=2 Tax=Halobacillus TaxID=45667 RepID=A0A1H0SKR5_HALAD|nr:TetR/AcrR family transcriptional regulator [Halobacillus aidingensis]SDP42333.1 DNA-binding transcriptional regulator, AcrR family [Halobacillus aidingensis]